MIIEKIFTVRLSDDSLHHVKFDYCFDTNRIICDYMHNASNKPIKVIRICNEHGMNEWIYDFSFDLIKENMLREHDMATNLYHSDRE